MDYQIYLDNEDNIFHQLRGHYMRLNIEEHIDFDVFRKPAKPEKRVDGPVLEKKSMQINIFEARMQKMNYIKMRRKGIALDEENETKNLQTINSSGYYTIDDLWDKLSANDISREKNEPKNKSWRQLTEDEQKAALKEFMDKFKDEMDVEVWRELRRDLVKHLREGDFNNNTVINWHRGTQKIIQVNSLVINPACFYWN